MTQGVSQIVTYVACAVVGALAALLVNGAGTGEQPSGANDALALAIDDLARRVEDLRRSVQTTEAAPALHSASGPGGEANAHGGSAVAEDARASTPRKGAARALRDPQRREAEPAAYPETAVRREIDDPPLPPTNRDRVDETGPWSGPDSDALRDRWFLASERSVLAWFGRPDGIYSVDGGERWEYRRSRRGVSLSVYLFRGRVIRMHP